MLAAIDWHIIWSRIFHPDSTFAHALWATIYISIVAQLLGILLGLIAALARMSRFAPFRFVSGIYVLIFRGTPVLVQIFFFYFALGLPNVVHLGVFNLTAEVSAGILALSINEGAYMREIIRAGIDSIDKGQMEAAKSLGMRSGLAMRRIILPQAARVIIPPLGNEFIGMVKMTSLASVIQYPEVLHNAENIYYANSRVIELLIVAGIWYLAVVSLLTPLQMLLERRFARGMALSR